MLEYRVWNRDSFHAFASYDLARAFSEETAGGAGHEVVGLARSDASAAHLDGLGAQVRRGDLDDLDGLAEAAADADGVIHLAFKHEDMQAGDFLGAVAADLTAQRAIGEALVGSGKPFVSTSGTMLLTFNGDLGRPGTEEDAPASGPRIDAENYVIDLAARDVRSSVVRLPPTVHSSLDHHGFIPGLIAIARERGVAGYVGDGSNRWPAGHTLDAAHLYLLALENAPAGTRLHAVDDEGVPWLEIAERFAKHLGVPAVSIAQEDLAAHFGPYAGFVGRDNPATSARTRALLGWEPTRQTLLADLDEGHYFAR